MTQPLPAPQDCGVSEETYKRFLALQTQTAAIAKAFFAVKAPALLQNLEIKADLLSPTFAFRASRNEKTITVIIGVSPAHPQFAAILPQIVGAVQSLRYGTTNAAEIRTHNTQEPLPLPARATLGRPRRCECDHISHFDLSIRNENGAPAHPYGHTFYDIKATNPFHYICPDCAAGHCTSGHNHN